MDFYMNVMLIFFVSFSVIFMYRIGKSSKKEREERIRVLNEKLTELTSGASEVTPEEFQRLRTAKIRGGKYEAYYSSSRNFPGVYILFNQDKNKYYVGQSKTVLSRVNSHFTGKGNGDVYVDYRNGDSFTIKLIPLFDSGFDDLNSLERHFISYYHAFANGYNRTRGNG